jgi:hypothetical protein
MRKLVLSLLFAALAVTADEYKMAPGGAPPADLPDSVKSLLEPAGVKITKDGAAFGEFWYRAALPEGKKTAEGSLSMPPIPHGALLAVFKLEVAHADRRGQSLKPGLYTMRYSYYPENGDHQGAAPQRDFLLLTPVANDKDGAATPVFDDLMVMSRKASGTPHPAVFSFWKEDPKYFKENTIEQQGEHDFVLMRKMGGLAVSLIIAGKSEA